MWLTIWSIASSEKLIVISSTIGRSPVIAAPTPTPTIVFSEIGVSRTRFSPNSSSRPCGDLERAVEDADVLAHDQHAVVALHLLAQRLVERLAVAELGHGRLTCAPSTYDVVVDRLGDGKSDCLGELDRLVDPRDRGLVERLEVVSSVELGRERLDRVALRATP